MRNSWKSGGSYASRVRQLWRNLERHPNRKSQGAQHLYEVFEHTADVGIRVQADTLGSLFAEAGRALFSVIVQNLDDVRPIETVSFDIRGKEIEFLFVDWLCELLFVFESRGLLLSRFFVSVDDSGVAATAQGEPFDERRHRLEHEVKAITYHNLKVEQTENAAFAEVILDI